MRRAIPAIAFAITLAACGGGDSDAATTTTAATETTTTTVTPSTEPPAPATTAAPETAPAFEINDDGEVSIDWTAVTQVSFLAPVPNATDPLFFVHNDPDIDGFYLGLEAYTVYGAGWTGELGTFDIDCESNGICLHFDPDGPGPAIDAGFDFLVTGTVEFVQADLDGFEAILTDVAFTDGTTIPGPLVITGGNAG